MSVLPDAASSGRQTLLVRPHEKIINTREEAAALLSVSLSTLDGYVRSGQLKRICGDRRVRFRRVDLEAFAQRLAEVE